MTTPTPRENENDTTAETEAPATEPVELVADDSGALADAPNAAGEADEATDDSTSGEEASSTVDSEASESETTSADEATVAEGDSADDRSEMTSLAAVDSEPKKRKMSAGRKGALALLAAAVAVGVGAAGAIAAGVNPTTVPTASATAKSGTDAKELCESFASEGIDCLVNFKPSDKVERGGFLAQSVEPGFSLTKPDSIELDYSAGPASGVMPNLKGMELDAAKSELYALGLNITDIEVKDVEGVEANRVASTSIKPDAKVANGNEVKLVVSSGATKLPDWSGKTRAEVETQAKKLGVKVTFKEAESDKPADTVIAQSPKKGETSANGEVTVTVAKAKEVKEVKVPAVIGKSADEAQSELAAAGFHDITVVPVKNAEVTEAQVTQVIPGEGKKAKTDSNVVIIESQPSK